MKTGTIQELADDTKITLEEMLSIQIGYILELLPLLGEDKVLEIMNSFKDEYPQFNQLIDDQCKLLMTFS